MPYSRQSGSPLTRAARAAVVGLLLTGQLLAGTGIPTPGTTRPITRACGCPADGHQVGTCCCAAYGLAAGTCCAAPAVEPEPEPEPVCPKCKAKAAARKAEPSARSAVASLAPRCLGSEPTTPAGQEPSTPPAPATAWSLERPSEPRSVARDPASESVPSAPPTHPPRSV
jgi:hypothetical protein